MGDVRRERRERYRAMSDTALVLAMRRDEQWAWAEYFARFYPPLEAYARRARIPPEEWSACVMDVLDDAAVKLTSEGAVLPTSLLHYLTVSVRHRFLNLLRDTRARQARYVEAASERDARGDRVVMSLCSDDAIRASRGPDGETPALRRALQQLAEVLAAALSERDRELLAYLGEEVPLARIADWLGLSYAAAAQRSSRLRRRLRTMAEREIARFPVEERADLEQFFRRARRKEGASESGRARTPGSGGDAA